MLYVFIINQNNDKLKIKVKALTFFLKKKPVLKTGLEF